MGKTKKIEKLIFLEYKFRDFTDDELLMSGATGVIAAHERLNERRVEQIKRMKLDFDLSFVLFSSDSVTCPLAEKSREKMYLKLKDAIGQKPRAIWLDYLKFPGTAIVRFGGFQLGSDD